MLLFSAAVMTSGFVACSDDLGPSIFDTHEYALDRTSYTFPLDSFVKVNFLEPYNLRYIYRMEDIGSDMDKNLVPARYEQSKKLAVLSKYLWYDIYDKYAGDLFLKENSPRIIHVIGSKSYNPSQGTETLGVAEGGIKITLYGANLLDENDIDYMNQYFFHTMHHEFSHILDQTKLHPQSFNTISAGKYDAMGWSDTPDSVSCGRGFVTSYGSSSVSEDLVEIASTYITADTLQWIDMLNSASYEWEFIDTEYASEGAMLKEKFGSSSYLPTPHERDTVGYFKTSDNGDKKIYRKACKRDADDHVVLGEKMTEYKELAALISNNAIDDVKLTDEDLNTNQHDCGDPTCPHNNSGKDYTEEEKAALLLEKIKKEMTAKASEKIEALDKISEMISGFAWDEKTKDALQKQVDAIIAKVTAKNYASEYKKIATACNEPIAKSKAAIDDFAFQDVQWIHDSGQTGKEIILNKLDLVRTWLNEGFGYSIDDIRREVQNRQWLTDADGNFVITTNAKGERKLVNRLTVSQEDGRTLMEHLLDEVEQYKALQK